MREPTTLRREGLPDVDHGTALADGVSGLRAPRSSREPAERATAAGHVAAAVATGPPATGPSASADPDALIWRFGALGGFLGFAAVAVGVAVPNVVAGQDPGASIGLGLFLGIWGGLGFGGMAGAAIAATRLHTGHG